MTIKVFKVSDTLTVHQKQDGVELIKGNEVFGLFLTWEDLKIILHSLDVICSPELEELQKLVEEQTPS